MLPEMKIISIIIPCIFFTCRMPGEVDYNNGLFLGTYKSVTLIYPGQADRGVDLIQHGAYLHIELKKKRQFREDVFIPESPEVAILTSGNEHNEGIYTIREDSVLFEGFSQLRLPRGFQWVETKSQLIYEWKGRGRHKIVLQKE